ncbi:MAG: class I SAM-dependent methyltransferase [Pseudomonadota bacterium]
MEESARNCHQEDGYKQNVVRHFTEYPSYWRRIYNVDGRETNMKYQINRRRNVILRFLDEISLPEDGQILDVGCGAGGIANEVLKRGHSVTCIDICRPMLELARESASELGYSRSEYLQGDMECLPFKKDSFDIAICAGVLSFLRQDDIGVSELARVLKPEGMAFITLPNLVRGGDLLDPYYLLRACKLIIAKCVKSGIHTHPAAGLYEPGSFPVRKYVCGQLNKLFRANELIVRKTVSLGYGPVTIWRREILPEKSEERLNEFLERMADDFFSPLRLFANHWVVCVQKGARYSISDGSKGLLRN